MAVPYIHRLRMERKQVQDAYNQLEGQLEVLERNMGELKDRLAKIDEDIIMVDFDGD